MSEPMIGIYIGILVIFICGVMLGYMVCKIDMEHRIWRMQDRYKRHQGK